MRPITDVAAELDLSPSDLMVYGNHMAKLRLEALPAREAQAQPPGRIILVSAINPTRAGEGKTTVSIGLAQGLRRTGRRVALALREPSLGPIFGGLERGLAKGKIAVRGSFGELHRNPGRGTWVLECEFRLDARGASQQGDGAGCG